MKALFVTDDYIIDPLGIAWLSAYLKDAGHETEIVKTKKDDIYDRIARASTDMFCYSVTTGKHVYFRELNKKIKQRFSGLSIFGGAHPTLFPEFAKEPEVDLAVMGEGFDTIVDIANAYQVAAPMENIPNVIIKDKINSVRPLKDKTDLLRPDRDLIYSYPENYHNPIKNIMASFFCPYSCPYCGNYKYKDMYNIKKAQLRPVDDVIDEALKLKDYPLDLIFFQDDIFPIYKREWIDMFCNQYSQVNVPFHVQTRVEFINSDVIRQLEQAGLHSVTFAIESGNQRLRDEILERKMSDEMIIKASEILHKHGVKFRTENMIGIPQETMETAMQTLDLNIKCRPTIAWASLFQPYPGTKLGEQCINEGLFDGNLDNIKESFFDEYKIKTKYATKFDRLQKLFSFIAKYKFLRPFTKMLISLPINYSKVYKRIKGKLYKELYAVRQC
jgi:radical SAM superfamily enzyme YgiQ (UPF0313 family)